MSNYDNTAARCPWPTCRDEIGPDGVNCITHAPLDPCGCLPDAGDVGGYITDVLHERGIHDAVLQSRLSDEARIDALDHANELLRAEGLLT